MAHTKRFKIFPAYLHMFSKYWHISGLSALLRHKFGAPTETGHGLLFRNKGCAGGLEDNSTFLLNYIAQFTDLSLKKVFSRTTAKVQQAQNPQLLSA